MERSVAIKKLTRLLGKKLGWRINAKAPTPEERAAAQSQLRAATDERERIGKLRRARMENILAADTEYKNLCVEYDAAQKHAGRLLSMSYSHKFTVGTIESGFFLVKAEGNSWEEVIDKVAAKEAVS